MAQENKTNGDFEEKSPKHTKEHETGARGQAGGQASVHTEDTSVSAAAFEKYLKGAHFPLDKQGIIDHLRRNHATEDISKIANEFEARQYATVADVAKEFGRVKREHA